MLDFLNRTRDAPAAWRGGRAAGTSSYLRILRTTQFDPPEVDPRPATRRAQGAAAARLRHRAVLPRARGTRPAFTRRREVARRPRSLPRPHQGRHPPARTALVSSAFDIAKLSREAHVAARPACRCTICIDEAGDAVEDGLHDPLGRVERLPARAAGGEGVGQPRVPALRLKGRLRNFLFDRAVYLDTLNLNDERIAEFATPIRRHRRG